VQGVSLKVPENSIVALLGTNGAGKSTTARDLGLPAGRRCGDQEGHNPLQSAIYPRLGTV
jgi:ABC-type uncharacterized transport system ATPase subunit